MHKLGLALLACSIACNAPEGTMAPDTETDTETGSSSATDGGMTMGTSVTMSTSVSVTNTATMSTADDSTSVDPDSSANDSASATASSTGECPPGELGCPCDVGSSCVDDLLCEAGTCVGRPGCDEPEGEPNDDEASAVELAEANCGDPPMMTMAGLDGAESDWFTYHAAEGIACFEQPNVAVAADIDLAVCVFAACDQGTASVNCSNGAVDSDSPDGAPGCCDQNDVGFGDINCGGFNGTSATIWVRVTSVEQECIAYELAWEY